MRNSGLAAFAYGFALRIVVFESAIGDQAVHQLLGSPHFGPQNRLAMDDQQPTLAVD
jgi:hypothetical protein